MNMDVILFPRFLVGGDGGFELSCSRERVPFLYFTMAGRATMRSTYLDSAAMPLEMLMRGINSQTPYTAEKPSMDHSTSLRGDTACLWGAASFFNSDMRSFSIKFLIGGVAEGNIKLGYLQRRIILVHLLRQEVFFLCTPEYSPKIFISAIRSRIRSVHPHQCLRFRFWLAPFYQLSF
ncbi:hypothetical protein EDD18DRAFT_749183 [Armillaria luteobubalina]|uniref:Uncharacterized protein n=1 Tax=Armillaria luteobubalina TaxID=153913 RepID=A0AA39QGS0_9AGAR|nr:hypothetical protein EDD18DRAFT_749183 [Armillaria luteobubalina]